jgi:hypothetical protein
VEIANLPVGVADDKLPVFTHNADN